MMKFIKKIDKNSGFSLMEIMVAVGLVGLISAGVMKLTLGQKKLEKTTAQNLSIDQAMSSIKSILSDKDSCEQTFASSLDSSSLDIISSDRGSYSPTQDLGEGVSISSITSSLEGSGRTNVLVSVNFEKKQGDSVKQIERRLRREVVVNDDGSFECASADKQKIEEESIIKSCVVLGGTMDGADCDLSGSNLNSDFERRIKEFICYTLGAAGLDGAGKCANIDLDGEFAGSNIDKDKICISGDCREKIETAPCPAGSFLTGVDVKGDNICESLSFSSVADAVICAADCSCALTTPSNASCNDGCGGSCQGMDCDYLDSYRVEGTRPSDTDFSSWASSSQVCKFDNYDDLLSLPNTCSSTSINAGTAGICKKFVDNSCSGTTSPSIENVPDGTSCGASGEVCTAGVCANTNDCTRLHPMSWTSGSRQCAEYYLAVGGGFSTSVIPDGTTKTFGASYCPGGGSCWGNIKIKCDNGSATIVSSTCNAGHQP